MKIGCILSLFPRHGIGNQARQKATAQMPIFAHSCQSMPLGLKLAAFISMIAADAIRPTTTGRRPENIAFIVPDS